MNPASFDLLEQPWIPVQDTTGTNRLVSISSAISEAEALRSIGGDIPTQGFAITRLLLAICRRGIDWGQSPQERWAEIWRSGTLPAAEIGSYLSRFNNRFDLLHPIQPFYQVADLHTAKGEFKPIELLITDVPPNEKYFTTRTGRGVQTLSYAEAARWVIHCQAFDVSGIKSADPRDPRGKGGKGYPIGIAWAGQLAGVVFEGNSLFETLMLNSVVVDADGNGPPTSDGAMWEFDQPDHNEREYTIPRGPADVLTWQSRRVRLVADDGMITHVMVANGDPLESHNRFGVEHMTGWRFSEPQSKKFGADRFLPIRWSTERAMWRGIESLLADVIDPATSKRKTMAPATAHWIERLVSKDILEPHHPIRAHAYGLEYINQASVVGASFDDTLPMHVTLLKRYSDERDAAITAADCATDAVRALGTLARRLSEAAGGSGEANRQSVEANAYFELDRLYRQWLSMLGGNADPSHDPAAVWESQVRRLIESLGAELVAEAGETAWRGRMVAGHWTDTCFAESMFRRMLRKTLPRAYDEKRPTEVTAP